MVASLRAAASNAARQFFAPIPLAETREHVPYRLPKIWRQLVLNERDQPVVDPRHQRVAHRVVPNGFCVRRAADLDLENFSRQAVERPHDAGNLGQYGLAVLGRIQGRELFEERLPGWDR